MGQRVSHWCGDVAVEWAELLHKAGHATLTNGTASTAGSTDNAPGVGLAEDGQDFNHDFEVVGYLGEGSFSTVRRVRHRRSGVEFACKTMQYSELSEAELAFVDNEVRCMQALAHRSIVRLNAVYRECERVHMVMEVVEGGELFDRIVQKNIYTEAEARTLMRNLLGAVNYMHAKRIVHRDLKPENLLMVSESSDCELKIADFGYARVMSDGPCNDVVGTAIYVSPEVLSQVEYGLPADMWSLGVIMYILLSGQLPFPDDDDSELRANILHGAYEFGGPEWRRISPEAKDLVARLLTVNQRQRITAAGALRHPWFTAARAHRSVGGHGGKHAVDTSHSLRGLRAFNARRKLRGAIKAIKSTHHKRKDTLGSAPLGAPKSSIDDAGTDTSSSCGYSARMLPLSTPPASQLTRRDSSYATARNSSENLVLTL